ncbi:o-succinylbenzoate synthase [Candidatus Gracilibacteria bacterium]|nr:o-succinylbenzoate synthase [Candidatus Gracilibacteria bacterium]
MKIERVELFVVRLPMVRSFATSSSRKTQQEHILVKAYAEGLVGWGECASPSDPYYCEETSGTCRHILRDFLVPLLKDKPWDDVAAATAHWAKVKRNNFAKAGLEMACWDLLGQARKQPLHALLGGTRGEILSGVSLGVEDDSATLFALIDQYLGEGYRRIKLKIAPGKDVDVVRVVRERYPDTPLMADANSAYTLADSVLLKRLDDFDLMMIEQPLAHDDIVDHAELQVQLRTPICLDESIYALDDARKALMLGSGRIINIKVSRVGGLLNAKRLHDYCYERGVPVWCGGMHEFGIGRAANLAIASLPGFTMPGDVSGSDKYYHEDIVTPPIRAANGAIAVPQGPGLGYNVDEEMVRRNTVETIAA